MDCGGPNQSVFKQYYLDKKCVMKPGQKLESIFRIIFKIGFCLVCFITYAPTIFVQLGFSDVPLL